MFYWKINRCCFRAAVIVSFFGIVLSSCRSEKQPATFYPVDSLVTGQIHYLAGIGAGLFKEAVLSGKTDTLTYVPADTVAWINELEVFRKLSIINKPVNKDSYEVKDGLFDPESNLKVKAFTALKKLPVVYLKVYYHGSIRKPRKIEALYDEANPLYKSGRLLSMHFQQIEDQTVLTSYLIRGGQRMALGDSVAFYVKGRILID